MEYLKSALSSIKQNKGRSFLTMLGIIIGIASVITILAIGNGMKSYVNSSLDDIQSGAVTINIDPKKTDKYLTADNLKLIESAVSGIYGLSPSQSTFGEAVNRDKTDLSLKGGTPVIERNEKDGIYKGRFFNDDEVDSAAYVCVITQDTAIYLFGTYDVVDNTIEVDVQGKSGELRIVGVMKSSESDIEAALSARHPTADVYDLFFGTLYVPYTLLTQRFGVGSDKITSFEIYTLPGNADESALKVKSVTENVMDLRGENAVKIQSFASMMATYTNILDMVTMVVAVIAAISLLVGGIGVMNIMTVTVTERTREIGIRKSLGARTQYILLQFLTESALITLIGGFVGIIMGALFTFVVSKFMSFPPIISPMNVLLVVSISIADGLFFGIYPAKRAAKMNPIEALRQE